MWSQTTHLAVLAFIGLFLLFLPSFVPRSHSLVSQRVNPRDIFKKAASKEGMETSSFPRFELIREDTDIDVLLIEQLDFWTTDVVNGTGLHDPNQLHTSSWSEFSSSSLMSRDLHSLQRRDGPLYCKDGACIDGRSVISHLRSQKNGLTGR